MVYLLLNFVILHEFIHEYQVSLQPHSLRAFSQYLLDARNIFFDDSSLKTTHFRRCPE